MSGDFSDWNQEPSKEPPQDPLPKVAEDWLRAERRRIWKAIGIVAVILCWLALAAYCIVRWGI